MTEGERHRALIFGLVGAKNHRRFMTSVQFRTSIETLARMLPPMIDGLAAAIDESDITIAQMAEQARRIPAIDEKFIQRLRDAQFVRSEYEGTWSPPEPPGET